MSVQIGNTTFESAEDFPSSVPIFPLSGALLLPKGQMPLNIFEPRYLSMIDAAMAGDRLIGMIQPALDDSGDGSPNALCASGCLGRIVAWSESGDGRYLITLMGVARFQMEQELTTMTPYRQARISVLPFLGDIDGEMAELEVDRDELLATFRDYLDANDMEADWDSINEASTESLVNALSMMSPYGPAEKQALLEAPDLKTRAETLIAITEMELARGDDGTSPLQ
ncbi:MAG: LON peptidase substrate-binding domain-containing protein [Alphaproteobacteria bacterium]|nr:LON peptidase substrate-binding domain-containing protein [Alphaproteobacteria bacterium]